jgi:hypothetical protein
MNSVSHLFPRGVLLATAKLVNCFYITGTDLKKAMTEPVALNVHGQEITTLDSPIGEPREDVEAAANSSSWESFVWELEDVKPVPITILIEKKSRSTWVSVDFEEGRGQM